MTRPISVLIRCDGSRSLGMGHLSRCRVLADALLSDHPCRVTFLVREGVARDRLAGHGYRVFQQPRSDESSYGPWLENATLTVSASVLVLDVRDDPPLETLRSLKRKGLVLATIDDASPTRLVADFAFYPPAPQTERLDWSGFSGSRLQGWEWVIVDRRFCRGAAPERKENPVVLVTMGGSDPGGLTLKAVRAIDAVEEDCDPWVVLGPHFPHRRELDLLLEGCRKRFRLLRDVDDMPEVVRQVDLAVSSFGVTAFELAASGVPALHLCLTPDHAESAATLMEAGLATSLGVHGEVSEEQLARSVEGFLRDGVGRRNMGKRGRACIDGGGANRIARTIVSRVQQEA